MTMPMPALARWAQGFWWASAVLFVGVTVWFFWAAIASSHPLGYGLGVICAGVAIAIGYLAQRTGSGDGRWRSALAMLTLTVTVIGMIFTVLLGDPSMLIAGLVSVAGSMMAYRPAADGWFIRKETHG